MSLRVALAAGHHNTSGGNAVEHAITGDLTEAYARELRRRGVDVRVVTPDGPDADQELGDGEYPGSVSEVGRKVSNWAATGWVPHLFLETHTEGVPRRGAFGVYPDWGDDYGGGAKRLGQSLAQAIQASVGIPIRDGGSMSEQATAVGRSGSRLGLFAATAGYWRRMERLIMEHGAHAHPADLAILQTPGVLDKIAAAAAEAIVSFYTGSQGDTITFPTGIAMNKRYGFYQFWEAHGGLFIFGYPITDEITEDGRTVQYFERARFELHPTPGGNTVMLGRVGAELLECRGK